MVKEKRYLINEAAKEVHVESHVLRYWEEELELPIKRNEQGHRIYTQEDVDRFIKIKTLKDQGLQLKAVKAVLEQKNNIDNIIEESDDMRADNPFAQKQYTKIAKISDSDEKKVVCIKNPEDIRWKENFEDRLKAKKELALQIKKVKNINEDKASDENENQTQLSEKQKQQMDRIQYLFSKLIHDSVESSINEVLCDSLTERISDSVRQDMVKELDYQFRLMEEREEERIREQEENANLRDEEYYKRIDELLRQCRVKGPKTKKTKLKLMKSTKDSGVKKNEEKKKFHLFKKGDTPKIAPVK